MELIDQVKTITCAFKLKKPSHVANCFKLGLSKYNVFLDTEHIKTIVISGHVSLCIRHILENQHHQALFTLNTMEQYLLNQNDEFFCLMCYLKALANFNLEEFEITLCYLSQMVECLMEPFIESRCYLLLGRTHLKMGNSDLAMQSLEKLKDSEFSNIMAYYMSLHYEMNNMQFMQMVVLEQASKVKLVTIYFVLVAAAYHINILYNNLKWLFREILMDIKGMRNCPIVTQQRCLLFYTLNQI